MEPATHTDPKLKRIRLFGVLFIVVGFVFSLHGGLNLIEIYSRKVPMFELEAVFTPEKGRMWSEFLAGLSVCLTGFLINVKAWSDSKLKER